MKKVRKKLYKCLAGFLSVCVMATSFSGIAWADYTDILSSDDEMVALFHTDDLFTAAQEAILEGNPVTYDDLSMNALGFDSKLENKYSDLFPDGLVYEIDAPYESSFAGEASIRTFIALKGEAASTENYVVQGDEKLYFMFINESENDLTMQADVDGWLTPEVKVVGTSAILDEEELDPDESEADVTTKPSVPTIPDVEEPDISTDSNADKDDETEEESGTAADETEKESESGSSGETAEETTAESDETEEVSDQLDDDDDSLDVSEEADDEPAEEIEEEKTELIGLSYHNVPRVASSIDSDVLESVADEPVESEPKETEPKESEPKETEPKETEPKETSSEEEKEQPPVSDDETSESESSDIETETTIEADSTEPSSETETTVSEEQDSTEKEPEYKSEDDIQISGKTGQLKGTLYGTISIDNEFRARAFVTSFSQLSGESAKLNTSGYSLMINQILHDGETVYAHPYEVSVTDGQWVDDEILDFSSEKVTVEGVQLTDPNFNFSITRSQFQEAAEKPGTYVYNAEIHYNLLAGYKVADVPVTETAAAETPVAEVAATEQATEPLMLMSADMQQDAPTTITVSWEDKILADNALRIDLDMEKIIPEFITSCVLNSTNQFNAEWVKNGIEKDDTLNFLGKFKPLVPKGSRIIIAQNHLAPKGNTPKKIPGYIISGKLNMDNSNEPLMKKWGNINSAPVQKLLARNFSGLELIVTNPSAAEVTITVTTSDAYDSSYNITPEAIVAVTGSFTKSTENNTLTLTLAKNTVLQIPVTALYHDKYYIGYAKGSYYYINDSGEQIAYCHNYNAPFPTGIATSSNAPKDPGNDPISLADFNSFTLFSRYDYENLTEEQLKNLENEMDVKDMDQEKVIALLYAGYPFDCEKLMEKHSVPSDSARIITQALLWQLFNKDDPNNMGYNTIRIEGEKYPGYVKALKAIINGENDYRDEGTLVLDGNLKMVQQPDGSYQTGLVSIKSSFGGSFSFSGLSDDILVMDKDQNPVDISFPFEINSEKGIYPTFIFKSKIVPSENTEFTLNLTYTYQKPALYYYEYLKNPTKGGSNQWINDCQNLVRIHLTDEYGGISDKIITVKPDEEVEIKPDPDPTPDPNPTPDPTPSPDPTPRPNPRPDTGGSSDSGGPEVFTPASSRGTPTPVTTEIVPEPVPLSTLPTTPFSETLLIIDDGNVPLAALPKTGQSTAPHKMAFALASLLLAVYSILEKRKKISKNN